MSTSDNYQPKDDMKAVVSATGRLAKHVYERFDETVTDVLVRLGKRRYTQMAAVSSCNCDGNTCETKKDYGAYLSSMFTVKEAWDEGEVPVLLYAPDDLEAYRSFVQFVTECDMITGELEVTETNKNVLFADVVTEILQKAEKGKKQLAVFVHNMLDTEENWVSHVQDVADQLKGEEVFFVYCGAVDATT